MAYVVLTYESEEIYKEIFHKLVELIKYHTKKESYKDTKIMCDFEIGLREAIKNEFKFCILQVCYFHYCKAIWKKIKKLHLFKKELRYDTIIIFFIMKVYPYIKEENRNNCCEKMETYCSNLGGNYIKLNKYFIKYWKDCDLFNFTNLDNNMIKNRTNNICESFHHKLNKKISHYHPKMSFLVNGLKNITKEYYNEYIKTLSIVNKKKRNSKLYCRRYI